jgi:hypothetical protein
VRDLRTTLADANVTAILLKLLDDPVVGVQECATAAICNIVLDFSPLKRAVIDGGGVAKLVEMVTEGKSEAVVVNALWAIKNLVYMADSDVKRGVVELLSFESLYRLCMSDIEMIKEQAVAILRNLVSSNVQDVVETVDGVGSTRIIEIVESAIAKGANVNIMCQALYVLVNIATSVRASDKAFIIGSAGLVKSIFDSLVFAQCLNRAEP